MVCRGKTNVIKMKIFLLVFFTFSFYGLGKAQRTDNHKDTHKFDVEYEYDDATDNFHDETSAVIDSDQNNGNIFEKREHRKCYPPVSTGIQSNSPDATYNVIIQHNSGPINPPGGLRKCYPEKENDRETPDLPDYEIPQINSESRDSCACGLESKSDVTLIINGMSETLIRNGTVVQPHNKYPWMVAIQKHGQTVCGGTLVNEQYIVTAAHCLGKDAIKVAFVTNTSDVSPGPPISTIFPHPKFDETTNLHDIALLKLSRRIQCTSFTRPICLPKAGISGNIGKEFVTIGWGSDGNRKGGTKDLMETKIKRVPFRQCPSKYKKHKETVYCLKGVEGGPCKGDSGGPMFVKHRHRHYLFGIASMQSSDNEKCPTEQPVLYTKVPKYMTWINTVIKKSSRLPLGLPKRSRQKIDEAGSQRTS